MTLIQATVLGLIQGITEFLPISSSGHLIFIPKLFGWGDQGLAFDAIIHLATLLAVVVYFRRRIASTVTAAFRTTGIINKEQRFLLFVILSIIPAGAIGFFFGDMIDASARIPQVVAWNLIGWGIVLGFADRYAKKQERLQKATSDSYAITQKQVGVMATAQAIALIPGTSRSGITMSAGIFSGLSKKAAAEFSFLMSIPIIALGGGLKLLELLTSGAEGTALFPLGLGFIVALLSGLFAIRFLMYMVEKWSLLPFAVYRVIVGVLILLFLV